MENNFGSEKIFGQKKILGLKNFWTEKMLGPKTNIGFQNFLLVNTTYVSQIDF